MSPTQGPQQAPAAGPAELIHSDTERGVAQAQPAHGLEAILQGIETARFAQDMAAQQELQTIVEMRAAAARYSVRDARHGQESDPGTPNGEDPGMPAGPGPLSDTEPTG